MDYDAGMMATRITRFYKLAVEFLIFLEQRADQEHRDTSLLESALRRELPIVFEVQLNKTNRLLAITAPKEIDYLFHRHQVEDLVFRKEILANFATDSLTIIFPLRHCALARTNFFRKKNTSYSSTNFLNSSTTSRIPSCGK